MQPIRYDLLTLVAAAALVVLGAGSALALLRRGRDRGTAASRWWWLLGGGGLLGVAIWSMHVMAMLAIRPTPGLTLAPLPMAVVAVLGIPLGGLAFAPLGVERPGARRLIASGTALGIAICVIHYAGMNAVRGGTLEMFEPLRVAASAFVAAFGSTLALLVAVRRNGPFAQAAAATGLGTVVAGAHMLGMSATTFQSCGVDGPVGRVPVGSIGVGIAIAVALLFVTALMLSLLDRRLAELARREVALVRASEQRLRAILDQLPLGIGIVEAPGGALVIANRQAHALLGRAPDFDGLVPVDASAAAVFGADGRGAMPLGRACSGERVEGELFLRRRADGSVATLEIGAAPILDDGGQQVLAVATVKDVTARVEAEAAAKRAQKMEALGQLTGGVAHDFNNLLTAVLNNLDLLEEEELDALGPLGRSRLRQAIEAAERGTRLTAQLLGFSRRQVLQPTGVDLGAVIGGMAELLASTLGRTAIVRTELAADLWPAFADPTQLELVLLNLAINARDAMPNGGTILIRASNVRTGPPVSANDPPCGEHVMLSVADTGIGMSARTLARAFEPFFTTKPAGKGSGLGLAQALGIVQSLGGGVQIQSRENGGTTVSLFMPRAATRAVAAAAPVADAAGHETMLAGRSVLVVDDDHDVRAAVAAIVRGFGCRVIEADSGQGALDAVAADPDGIDIALLDHAMPGLTGAETIRLIRAGTPLLPVMLMTGYAEPEVLAALGEGADRVPILLKPFRGATLFARLAALLDDGAARRTVATAPPPADNARAVALPVLA